jgi:histidine triad (HIT) family protein
VTESRDSDCIFCKILAGELPSKRVAEGAHCIAIEDRFPQAPVHCLVMPKKHIASLGDATEADASALSEMLHLCQQVAALKKIDQSGYRVLTNVGADGGQAVLHLHFHVLGGKRLGAKLVAGA